MNGKGICCSLSGVTLVPRYSGLNSRGECDPSSCGYTLPLVASPMDTVYSDALDRCLTSFGLPVVVHRYFPNAQEQLSAAAKPLRNRLRFFAVGKDREWIEHLWEKGVRRFCCDFAHGDSKPCVETVQHIKSLGRCIVMAGNVATKSGFIHLEDAGADMVRVGIGAGSACTTRANTGFGVPLVQSLVDAVSVRRKAVIIADGGIWYPGDIAKCMAFGADLCMAGRMLAATSESGATKYDDRMEITTDPTQMRYAEYRGMASKEARGSVMKHASVEGVSGLVPYLGETKTFLEDLRLNLQASLSYAGVTNWGDFRRHVKKIEIDISAWYETITHTLSPGAIAGKAC